jgi:uncharacterized membrane protein YhiD involved in acid resistance
MMPEWLIESIGTSKGLPTGSILIVRAVLTMLAGFMVAGVHRIVLGHRHENRTLPTTLVLLCVLVGLVTMVIGDNVARAFGLVGALSIVRFRTVVEDTRDTAFVIFAVVVGMGIGAGYAILAVVCIPIILLAAWIMIQVEKNGPNRLSIPAALTVRIGLGFDPEHLFQELYQQYLLESTLVSVASARQGACLELHYRVKLREANSIFPLVEALNKLEGVQQAELKRG